MKARETVTIDIPEVGPVEIAAPPRGEAPDYYYQDLESMSARERIRRSIRQIASTEATDKAFAERIEQPRSYVCNWLKGKCSPDLEVLARIGREYKVSMEDVFAGTACTNSYVNQVPGGSTSQSIPYYGDETAVGFPQGIIEELKGSQLAAWSVKDSSMSHLLPAGSIALVALGSKVDDPCAPYLVEVGGQPMLRKVRRYAAGWLLSPACDDPTVDELLVKSDDPEAPEVKVCGKVVWYQLPDLVDWSAGASF